MKIKEFVRNPHNYDVDELSDETGLLCTDETLTEQEHIEEADINYIAERFMRTGEIRNVLNMPTQGDFEGIFDFQSAMNTIVHAKNEFMKLPAKTRSRFNNDPQELLAFINDKTNRDEAIKLGFIPKSGDNKGDFHDTATTGRPATFTEKNPQGKEGSGGTQADKKTDATTEKP